MRHLLAWGLVLATALCAAGCARMTTKIVEKPRVDQELAGAGNRGYLLGDAPAAGPRKTTRKMIETDIELPTKEELNPWRKPTSRAQPSAGQGQVAQAVVPATEPGYPPAGGWATEVPGARQGEWPLPPVRPLPPAETWESEGEEWEARMPAAPTAPAQAQGTTYTVQKGDTLQKIASKFYGSSKPWRKIYEANQASLKGPDRIYPGQKIIIPPAGQESEEPGSEYK